MQRFYSNLIYLEQLPDAATIQSYSQQMSKCLKVLYRESFRDSWHYFTRISARPHKLTRYLLVYKARNDKSQFLAKAGFTLQNPEALRTALKTLVEANEAVEDISNEYGNFYQVVGIITGANGISLSIITVWLKRQIDGNFQFITLKPRKESRP
jgi:hypothetical protein